MAKVKITFTDDHIKLIRNLRINQLENKYYLTTANEKQMISKVNNKKYNLIEETDMGDRFLAQINIENNQDFDNQMIGVDSANLWGGTFIFEDMAYILGCMDKIVPGTEEDPLGPSFEQETMDYLVENANFIVDHLKDIEEILHQFCIEGIKAGVAYVRNNNSDIWSIAE